MIPTPPEPTRSAVRAATLLLLVGAGCAPVQPPAAGPAAAAPSIAAADCPAGVPDDALIDVRAVDPAIRTDVRYATADNFTGAALPGYEDPRVLLRPDAARALGRVSARLRAEGFGLKVWDGYRPVRATLAMVDWAERTGNQWVLEQGYVARRSGHNRGDTVDLTLVRLPGGEELPMGTAYDEFVEAAHTANATGEVAANRARLLRAMEAEGWVNYDKEWWHFTLPGRWEPLDVPIGCFR